MILRFTPEAREDIQSLKKYIAEDLRRPKAAARIVDGILEGCSELRKEPYSGIDLSAKTGRYTSLKYIVTSNYVIFYRIEGKYVSIIRVLDYRMDCMRVLFAKRFY